jgi:hypothetical protein
VTRMSRDLIVTALTGVIVGLWLVSAVVRIWHPWPEASVLDSAMPLVIGYYFISKPTKRNGSVA